MSDIDKIVGRGWSFPPSFTPAGVAMTEGKADIDNSLTVIFNTAIGERVMQPEFGCNLHTMIMEPMNTGNLAYIRDILETAILYHEPRIDAESITIGFSQRQGRLDINVEYRIRGSNSRFNSVFPFYLAEGEQ